jgi:hypothetical protein
MLNSRFREGEEVIMKRSNPGTRTLALVLSVLLIHATAADLLAQSAGSTPRLQITILDGEGALNNIKLRTAREPIIQVEDENHKPVAGAVVIFLLPDSGPSGIFADGTTTLTTTTDAEGKAVATGLKPNNLAGKYQIRVQVKRGDEEAEATIGQANFMGALPSASTAAAHAFPAKWVIVGIAAAGGVAAGVIASRGGTRSTTITAGPPTVGAPQ